MNWLEHPWTMLFVWIGFPVLTGFLGYRQGRKDEELEWRRWFRKERER